MFAFNPPVRDKKGPLCTLDLVSVYATRVNIPAAISLFFNARVTGISRVLCRTTVYRVPQYYVNFLFFFFFSTINTSGTTLCRFRVRSRLFINRYRARSPRIGMVFFADTRRRENKKKILCAKCLLYRPSRGVSCVFPPSQAETCEPFA